MTANPQLIRELLLASAELPEAELAAFLAGPGGDGAKLGAAIELLLARLKDPAGNLDPGGQGSATKDYTQLSARPDPAASTPITEQPGSMVGNYKLMEQIGEGGFGLVFVAEQVQPVRRKVALKLIKPGMDSRQVIARFEAERQALALMDHPGIARVLDAGTTESGRPYFVMELVRGIPITEYCDKNQLTPRERLELFIDICCAIQHAHQKGIIHRDVKPSNVLVTSHDGKPVVKVIDFGVAKAINQHLTERTIYTQLAQMIGTPLYMSPEQAEMSGLDIDTRSDIYSLGVLLYELLTGSTPLERRRFAHAACDEIRRLIREEETPPPSQRLSTLETLPSVAANRKTEPAKLRRMIRGELDWVVMKALEKDRTRRYETANGLARDIERYLADEVVEARPASTGYRLRKFARKNRTALVTSAMTLLAGVAGLGAVLVVQRGANRLLAARNADLDRANISLHEAIQQKDAANTALEEANGRVQARFELAREAIRSFKEGVEEEEALKENRLRPLRDKLLGSARRFYDRLGDLLRGQIDSASKAVLAESYAELGELIDRIGQKPEALEAYKKAVAIRRELAAQPWAGASERVKLSHALSGLGEEAFRLGDHAGGLAAHEEARALAEPLAAGPGATIEARRALGSAHEGAGQALQATGQVSKALAAFRRALEARDAVARDLAAVPDDRKKLAVTFNWLGDLLERTGDLAGALAEYRKDLELMRALAAEHPEVPDYRRELAVSHGGVGALLEKTGDLAAALAEQRRYQELMRALAAEHPAVLNYRHNVAVSHDRIGRLLERIGDLAGALAEYRKGQELMRALAGEHPEVPDYRRGLAVSYFRVGNHLTTGGKPAEALAELERARFLFETLAQAAPNVPDYRDALAFALNYAGDAHRDLGRSGEARDRHVRAVALAEALASEYPKVPGYRARLADSLRRLARLKLDAGDGAGADADARRAVALFEGLPTRDGRELYWLACARAALGAAAVRSGAGTSAALESDLADRAMNDLRQAVAAGYRSSAMYRHESALAPLRGRGDFQLLLLDLAMPADAFATARSAP